MHDTWEQIFWAKRNETQRRVCSKNTDMIFEEFGNQLDVLSRLSSEPFLQTLKKGPFLCSNDFDAKHESEHSVNSSFKASSSSSRWLLLLSWAMNYHSHRQLSTGILLAMGGLLCEVWARKPTFEEGEGGGINTLTLVPALSFTLTRDVPSYKPLAADRNPFKVLSIAMLRAAGNHRWISSMVGGNRSLFHLLVLLRRQKLALLRGFLI